MDTTTTPPDHDHAVPGLKAAIAEASTRGDRPSRTGWTITRDHITPPDDDLPSRVGTGATSSRGSDYLLRGLKASDLRDPVAFRVLDDDGIVYYSGVISREWLEGDETRAFAPLDFASHDAGATVMQYRGPDAVPLHPYEKWTTL